MPQGWLLRSVFAIGIGLAAWGDAVPARAAELSLADKDLLQVLEHTEGGDLDQDNAGERCVSSLSTRREAEKMRHVIVGLLQVRQEEAFAAACNALVKSTASGSYPAERFRAFALNEDPETNLLEFGRFMRAIFFAHYIEPASTAPRASKP